MATGYSLVCPVRGILKATGRSKDGLTPTEERRRVEAIRALIALGYPQSHFLIEPVIQFLGNSGRNTLRADFAILDQPATASMGSEWVLEHATVLAEIKRDSKRAKSAIKTQVEPLLGFTRRADCIALYWDDVHRLAFWQQWQGGRRSVLQAPAAAIPRYGAPAGIRKLTLEDLRTDSPIRAIFERIEDALHAGGVGPSTRFDVMLQLLLAKIFDEKEARTQNGALTLQDFKALGITFDTASKALNDLLSEAVDYYSQHLPRPVNTAIALPDATFFEVVALLAPHALTAASNSVVQDFYMYFAKGLYKWDLAQYFTPPPITQFIIDIVAPAWKERVVDPACGSADFLTSAYRRGAKLNYPDYATRVFGWDSSEEAVQIAVLNMVLNGDGKSNITLGNSLTTGTIRENYWDVVVCNPPFGTRIQEKTASTLRDFQFGREGFSPKRDGDVLASQQTGILFVEQCVKLASKGGRIALVVPNGYLGNISPAYIELRRHLLRSTRIAAIIGLPRFAFKSSGADVSTSLIFLEKREKPLKRIEDTDDYPVAVHIVNDVGWSTGDKRGSPVYQRDEESGALILDDSILPILAADFDSTLSELRNSPAGERFEWLARGSDTDATVAGHVVHIRDLLDDQHLTLDPKRWSRKSMSTRERIKQVPHFRLGDIVEVVPEKTTSQGKRVAIQSKALYGYVEVSGIDVGNYRREVMRGWELPDRAKHVAEPGDIYVASVWSSVRKWMMVGTNINPATLDPEDHIPLVVTNGMTRLRLLDPDDPRILDLVAGLCSEAYAIQMRSLARGSDGLAEIRDHDLLDVLLPRVEDSKARGELQPFVDAMRAGFTGVGDVVNGLNTRGQMAVSDPPARGSHVQLV